MPTKLPALKHFNVAQRAFVWLNLMFTKNIRWRNERYTKGLEQRRGKTCHHFMAKCSRGCLHFCHIVFAGKQITHIAAVSFLARAQRTAEIAFGKTRKPLPVHNNATSKRINRKPKAEYGRALKRMGVFQLVSVAKIKLKPQPA